MRLCDALVLALRDWNVRYVFGVSGANIEHVHDAIARLGEGRLEAVMSRREDGAAFMADGRARVHRTLGVCCSTSGAAMLNLAVGLAEAYAESVPVLALVGQAPTTLEGRGAFQDSSGVGRAMDAMSFFGAFTKRVAKITHPAAFWAELRAAVTAAITGRPGPAVLLLPRDVYERDVGDRPRDWPECLVQLARPPEVDPARVRPLFERLRGARRPVLLMGHGVRRSSDPDSVVRFARRAGIPVATTMSARAEFPNSDPLYLGVVGVSGHPSAHAYVRDADMIVVTGAGLNAMTRPPLGEIDPSRIAAVNVDPGEIERAVAPATVVRADAGAVFRALSGMHEVAPFLVPPLAGYRLTRFLPRLAPAAMDPRRSAPPTDPRSTCDDLLQSQAIAVLEEFLPEDGHLVLDAGNCAVAAIHLTRVPRGASSTIALGAAGMGYAIGAAIGAQLGSPSGTRTVALVGDGAFLMNGLEIHSAVDLELPILFVVFNNQMHGMCVTRQQRFFGSRIECSRYSPLDVETVARGLGSPDALWTGSAGSLDELRDCLSDYAGRTARPGVLELRLSREELPPFIPLLPPDEPTAAA